MCLSFGGLRELERRESLLSNWHRSGKDCGLVIQLSLLNRQQMQFAVNHNYIQILFFTPQISLEESIMLWLKKTKKQQYFNASKFSYLPSHLFILCSISIWMKSSTYAQIKWISCCYTAWSSFQIDLFCFAYVSTIPSLCVLIIIWQGIFRCN